MATKQAIDVAAIGLNLYRGSQLWKHRAARGVYGGQVVAQAMTAAEKSLDKADFLFHSLHCYFVNSTKPSPDVIYEVENLKDGKSFCSRSVKAWQEGRIVFHALVSLYKAEATSANLSHSSSVMPDVPRPPDNDAEDSDGRFTPFNYTGYEHAHMYMYWPDEQRKAWKTHTPFHPSLPIFLYEALGLCPEGKGATLIDSAEWITNRNGHPIGATGLAQCAEICWQLRGMSDKRQVDDARVGLQQNFGIGGAAVVTLFRKHIPGAGSSSLKAKL